MCVCVCGGGGKEKIEGGWVKRVCVCVYGGGGGMEASQEEKKYALFFLVFFPFFLFCP